MWKIYVTESPTNFDDSFPIHILDFKESHEISLEDFRNSSKSYLYIHYYATNPSEPQIVSDGGRMSAYVNTISSGNLVNYTRLNVVKRYVVDGTHVIKGKYEGNAFQWSHYGGGEDRDIYDFQIYEYHNSVPQFLATPKDIFHLNESISHKVVLSAYLVACQYGNDPKRIGTTRILWKADFSDFPQWETIPDSQRVQYWFGPVIPQYLINEMVDDIMVEDENAPLKPTEYDPTDALTGKASTANFTWSNAFKVTNWSVSKDSGSNLPWPSKYLVDQRYQTLGDFYDNYCIYTDVNDSQNLYHIRGNESGSTLSGLRGIQKHINDNKAIQGSDIWVFSKSTTSSGYFCTFNNDIDGLTNPDYKSYNGNMPVSTIRLNGVDTNGNNVWLEIKWANALYNNLSRVEFQASDGTKFSIEKNYGTIIPAHQDLSDSRGFCLSPTLLKHGGHYFLASVFSYGATVYPYSRTASLCIICQIDNLIPLHNYGGGDPGDPIDLRNDPNYQDYANGLTTTILNAVFSNTKLEASPTTDSLTNDAIGDAPADENDGSPYNPDGTPRDPADNKNDPGTGEKNTNPIDSTKVPNSHDGSLGNGTGNPHDGDEKIPDPAGTLPDDTHDPGTVSGSGVLSVFTPTQTELNNFTSELLSTTVLDSIKNYFTTNPMDGIFGLHMLPYSGFAGSAIASPRIGTHTFTSTMTLASTEYINVNYGTVYVPFVYDGYENYAPYSDVKIFLPYIGTKEIDINIIQGCRCTLKYNISLVTGDIYAYMYAQWGSKWGAGDEPQGIDHLVYSWQGNCAATIPLSHLDSTNYISGAMQIAGGITSLVAGAAAANPLAMTSGAASTINGAAEVGRTSIITSGNISGMSAFMGEKTPFFIFSRPIIAFNKSYNHYVGQRSNAICLIGDLTSGTFTQMSNIDLAGIPATDEELSEIDSILKGGFYI